MSIGWGLGAITVLLPRCGRSAMSMRIVPSNPDFLCTAMPQEHLAVLTCKTIDSCRGPLAA